MNLNVTCVMSYNFYTLSDPYHFLDYQISALMLFKHIKSWNNIKQHQKLQNGPRLKNRRVQDFCFFFWSTLVNWVRASKITHLLAQRASRLKIWRQGLLKYICFVINKHKEVTSALPLTNHILRLSGKHVKLLFYWVACLISEMLIFFRKKNKDNKCEWQTTFVMQVY